MAISIPSKEAMNQYVVQKPTALIHASCTYSIQQRKMVDVMLRYVQQTLEIDPEARKFTINLSQLKALANIKATNNTQIKKALNQLREIEIEANILWKDGSLNRGYLIPFYSVNASRAASGKPCIITFRLAEEILEQLKKPQAYGNFNILLIPHLLGVCYPVYQILEEDAKGMTYKETVLPIDKYKRIIGVTESDYSRFRDFTKKKIAPLKELEANQHISIDSLKYDLLQDEEKSVTHIKITHHWSAQKKASDIDNRAVNKLVYYGFTMEEIWPYLSNPNRGAKYILQQVEGLEQQYSGRFNAVQNRKGLIKSAIEKGYNVSSNLFSTLSTKETMRKIDRVGELAEDVIKEVDNYLHAQTGINLQKIKDDYLNYTGEVYWRNSSQYHLATQKEKKLEKYTKSGRFSKFIYVRYLQQVQAV